MTRVIKDVTQTPSCPGYRPWSNETYEKEAQVIQARVESRRAKGETVTSDRLWKWIKERHPTWVELDWERIFQKVKL